MSLAPFAVEFVVVIILTLYLLHRYGDLKKQHIIVTLAVFVAWLFSFLIVVILPLDVSNTFYLECLEDKGNTNISLKGPCVPPWTLMQNAIISQ